MRNLLLIFLSILCLASNCKKEEMPTYYMPQEFKDFVVFPQGSYWIFVDSDSGEYDSLNLTNSNIYIKENKNSNFYYERMDQNFYSSKSGNFNTEAILTTDIYEYLGNKYRYYFDISTGRLEATFGRFYAKYDSLKISNVWYKDVICLKLNGSFESYYFWVKYKGLVKSEISDSLGTKTWLLDRYHIN